MKQSKLINYLYCKVKALENGGGGSGTAESNTHYILVKLPSVQGGSLQMEIDVIEDRALTGYIQYKIIVKGTPNSLSTVGWGRAKATIVANRLVRPSNLGEFDNRFDVIFGKKDGVSCVAFRDKLDTNAGNDYGRFYVTVSNINYSPQPSEAKTPTEWSKGWVIEKFFQSNIGLLSTNSDLTFLNNSELFPLSDLNAKDVNLDPTFNKNLVYNPVTERVGYVDEVTPTVTLVGTGDFQNGWNNISTGNASAGYVKIGNVVYLNGLVNGGTMGTSVFTLPTGYRPIKQIITSVVNNNQFGRVDILTNGDVVPHSGNVAGWVSLAGVNFIID